MRISKIELKNIHSLKGEFQIDFEKNFKKSGIFAITGETGAGKTTILDAITLALFKRIPRHATKSLSDLVVTKGEKDAFSRVFFSVRERQFLAVWSVKKIKIRDEFKTDEHLLYELKEGKYVNIAQKKRETEELVVEITGLDFQRFKKAVLLSQGEFAEFLKTDMKEKAAILEQISGSLIYSDIAKLIFKNNKELADKKKAAEDKKKQFEGHILTEEEFDTKKSELKSIEEEIQNLAKKSENLRAESKILAEISTLETKNKEIRAEFDRLSALKISFLPLFARLEKHGKLSPFLNDLHRLTSFSERIQKRKADLKVCETESAEKKQGLKMFESDVYQAEKNEILCKKNLNTAEKVFQENILPLRGKRAALLPFEKSLLAELEEMQLKNLSEKKKIEDLKLSLQKIDNDICFFEKRISESLIFETFNTEILAGKLQEMFLVAEKVNRNKNEVKKIGNELALYEKECNDLTIRKNALSESILKEEAQTELLRNKIQDLLAEQTFEFWENEKIQSENRILNLKKAGELAQKKTDSLLAAEKIETLIVLEKQSITDLLTRQTTENQALEDAQRRHDLSKKELLFAHSLKSFSEHRASLTEGEPCPLCGAAHHPYTEELPDFMTENEAAKNEKEAEKKLKTITEKLASTEKMLAVAKNEIENLLKKQADIKTELAKNLHDFTEILHLLNFDEQTEKYIIEENLTQTHTYFFAVKEKLEKWQNAQKSLTESEKILNEKKNAVPKLSAELLIVAEKIAQNSQKITHYSLENEALIKEGSALKNDCTLMTDKIQKKLPQKIEQLNDLLNDINQQKNELFELKNKLTELRQEKISLNENLTQTSLYLAKALSEKTLREEKLTETSREIAVYDLELSKFFETQNPENFIRQLKEQHFESQNNLEELKKQQNSLQNELNIAENRQKDLLKELNEITENSEIIRKELLKKLPEQGFENIETALNAILSPDEVEKIEQKRSETDKQILTAERDAKNIQQQLEEKKNSLRENFSQENIQILISETEQFSCEKNKERDNLTYLLKKHLDSAAEIKQIERENKQTFENVETWAILARIAGKENGNSEFRQFAQKLTLEKLIQYANKHLFSLNKRYEILQKEDEELGLFVIDHDKNDDVRPVKTLSGGETFLLSLALALGLSDLARGKNVKIESLFIDEGFGTLDANFLEDAIIAIENLRGGNKLIGVISHVDLLKQRIAAQIEVVKKQGGASEIRIKPA